MTGYSIDFERGRHAAVTEILDALDVVKEKSKNMTDQRAAACCGVGLAMACVKIVDIENRWGRSQDGPLHDRQAP